MSNLNLFFWVSSIGILLFDYFFGEKFAKIIALIYAFFVLIFISLIKLNFGTTESLSFFGIYFIEFLLSIDHVFIFLIITSSFGLINKEAGRVISFGIIFAIISRIFIISIGMKAVEFSFVTECLGCFLVLTAVLGFLKKSEKENPVLFFVRYFNKINLSKIAVPAVFIGIIDVVFSLDSIPASISFSKNIDFIIWANVLTLIGMKSVFSIMKNLIEKFVYIKYAISAMLFFAGIKLILQQIVHIPIEFTVLFMILSILISVFFQKRHLKTKNA